MPRSVAPATVVGEVLPTGEPEMTDETTRYPDSRPDETEMETDDGPARRGDGSRPEAGSDEGEPNPLLRDGPDAPDAADIEDPSEQL